MRKNAGYWGDWKDGKRRKGTNWMIMTRSNIKMTINGICPKAAPRKKKRKSYTRQEEGAYTNEAKAYTN